jgi:signal transduction histidine kinase
MPDIRHSAQGVSNVYRLPRATSRPTPSDIEAPSPALQSLIEAIPARVAVLDPALRMVATNQPWREMESDTDTASSRGTAFNAFFGHECSKRDLALLREGLLELACSDEREFIHRYVRHRGERCPVLLHASHLSAGGELLLLHLQDLMQPADNELIERRHQIEILLAEEEERRRIARELHDETFQQLTLIRFGLDALKQFHLGEEMDQAWHTVEGALSAVQHQVRTLSYVLHPPELNEGGLGSALASFIKGFGRRSGLAVQFNDQSACWRRSPDIEVALYRVAQEALANVMKHARATSVEVRLICTARELVLEVSDDGIGIPATVANGEASSGLGVGLASMRERIEALAGELTVNRLNPGTLVRAHLSRKARR